MIAGCRFVCMGKWQKPQGQEERTRGSQIAANAEALRVAEVLIQCGRSNTSNASDAAGFTPLMYACENGCMNITEMMVRDAVQVMHTGP